MNTQAAEQDPCGRGRGRSRGGDGYWTPSRRESDERVQHQSIIAIAVRPKGDRPTCSGCNRLAMRGPGRSRRPSFEEVARRLEDALTSVLAHRNCSEPGNCARGSLSWPRADTMPAGKLGRSPEPALGPGQRGVLCSEFRSTGRLPPFDRIPSADSSGRPTPLRETRETVCREKLTGLRRTTANRASGRMLVRDYSRVGRPYSEASAISFLNLMGTVIDRSPTQAPASSGMRRQFRVTQTLSRSEARSRKRARDLARAV